MMDRPHLWIGQKWVPTFGHDAWDRAVRKHWPDAIHEVVIRGAVWWSDGKVVAEMRNRRGWPPREAWVAERRPIEVQDGQTTDSPDGG